MTLFAALAVLLIAATTLMVFAGREYLRINVYPPVRPHTFDDLASLALLGFSALNEASTEATRRRMTGL
jgi:hypothetical protein